MPLFAISQKNSVEPVVQTNFGVERELQRLVEANKARAAKHRVGKSRNRSDRFAGEGSGRRVQGKRLRRDCDDPRCGSIESHGNEK
jgi:hypothetical protein